jgi:hypothetical protein
MNVVHVSFVSMPPTPPSPLEYSIDTPSAPRAANALHTLMDAARDPLKEVLLSAGYNRRYTWSVHILIRLIRRSDHTRLCSLASNEVDGVQQRIMRGPVALVPSGLRREEANRDAVHEADLYVIVGTAQMGPSEPRQNAPSTRCPDLLQSRPRSDPED